MFCQTTLTTISCLLLCGTRSRIHLWKCLVFLASSNRIFISLVPTKMPSKPVHQIIEEGKKIELVCKAWGLPSPHCHLDQTPRPPPSPPTHGHEWTPRYYEGQALRRRLLHLHCQEQTKTRTRKRASNGRPSPPIYRRSTQESENSHRQDSFTGLYGREWSV